MYTLDDYFKDAKLKMTVPFAPHIQMNPTKIPMKHQISGLNKLLTNDYYGLYDEPGTGKTLICHADFLYWVSEGQKSIAVMPPNLVYQFEEELYSVYWGADKYVKTHILDQPPVKRRELYSEWEAKGTWPEMLIMSYQMFLKEGERWIDNYRVAFFDEAQALKNSKSKIYKEVKAWQGQKGGTAGVFMTGTAIHNELIDAYAHTELTSPGTYKDLDRFERDHRVYKKFKLREPRKTKWGWQRSFKQPVGYKEVPTIKNNLYKHARRVQKRDISDQVEPTVTEVAVKLAAGHLKLYQKLVRERILEVGDELIIAANQQSLRQKCLQIVTCPEIFTEHLKYKNNIVEAAKEILDGIDMRNRKVILFANYRDSVKSLANHFARYNPVLMFSESNNENSRKAFLGDDDCRMLIANPLSAGAGYNFQSVCSDVIFMEPTGVPGDFKQALSRVDRTGQRHLVNIWILKALGTISPKATQNMLRKETEAQEVYDDKYTFLADFKVQ